MTTNESVIANDDGLLNKANILKMLTGIKAVLDNGNEQTYEERSAVFDIETLITKTDCCIYTWSDVAELYLRIYCTLKGITLKNEHGEIVKRYLQFLDTAHRAVKPHVIEPNAQSLEELKRLGFGKSR
jgi:hypothetical protein